MGIGAAIQNQIDINMSMGMAFKNTYGCEYSSTLPESAPTSIPNHGNSNVNEVTPVSFPTNLIISISLEM